MLRAACKGLFRLSFYLIEKDLCRQLEALIIKEPISFEKLQVYQNSLTQVIESDSANSSVLIHIKRAYDKFVEAKMQEIQLKDAEILQLKETLDREQKAYKKLNKTNKLLVLENADINRQLNDRSKDNMLESLNSLRQKLQSTQCKYEGIKEAKVNCDKALQAMREKGLPVDEYLFTAPVNSIPIYIEKETLKFDPDSPYVSNQHLNDPSRASDSLDFNNISPINVRSVPEFK